MHRMRRTTDIPGRHFARDPHAVPLSWREAWRRLRSGMRSYSLFVRSLLSPAAARALSAWRRLPRPARAASAVAASAFASWLLQPLETLAAILADGLIGLIWPL